MRKLYSELYGRVTANNVFLGIQFWYLFVGLLFSVDIRCHTNELARARTHTHTRASWQASLFFLLLLKTIFIKRLHQILRWFFLYLWVFFLSSLGLKPLLSFRLLNDFQPFKTSLSILWVFSRFPCPSSYFHSWRTSCVFPLQPDLLTNVCSNRLVSLKCVFVFFVGTSRL